MSEFAHIWRYEAGEPFMFTSALFWVFFGIVLLGHALTSRQRIARTGFLFLASLFFYYKAGGYFFFLLVISTLTDFFIGLGLEHFTRHWKRKLLLIISLAINLGMLGYFKYAWFVADIWGDITGQAVEAKDWLAIFSNAVFGSSFEVDDIVLPVGISFFTFQTISYTMDVYRRQLAPVHNILDFGFYVSFFPQLVAGPIVRARDFVPQLYRQFSLTEKQAWHATFLILSGLLKKIVFSDYIAVNLVDRVFESPFLYSGFEVLSAIYGYTLQIYCDFSGYTDVAIGLALLLGFRLPLNFNSPYKALSISEFWHRWHISLSSWLRDYLYIPLGGKRKGKFRTHLNLMITMTLGGLWHGASWRFVLWGIWHGMGLIADKLVKPLTRNLPLWLAKPAGFFITFHFVVAGWILFRANNLVIAREMTNRIFSAFHADLIWPAIQSNFWSYLLIALGFIFHWLPAALKENLRGWFITMHWTAKVALVALAVVLLLQFRTTEVVPFIYFRF
ncbi:MBOAT family O-acyltransferase [Marinilabilia salmonicolor]|uniref:MBOAT family O-acyltransferase n=1 Tax=Marinilabilia salmonicolor TaxID=989 RepID=UPI00029B4732|nr:MBOAT family O-acyltransferase [Marinilabilia salmonicolor]